MFVLTEPLAAAGMCMDSYTKAGDPAWQDKCNKGDVQFLLDNDFDSVKIDNCGDDRGVDFTSRMAYMNASGKAFVVENSNQGFVRTTPHRPAALRERERTIATPRWKTVLPCTLAGQPFPRPVLRQHAVPRLQQLRCAQWLRSGQPQQHNRPWLVRLQPLPDMRGHRS